MNIREKTGGTKKGALSLRTQGGAEMHGSYVLMIQATLLFIVRYREFVLDMVTEVMTSASRFYLQSDWGLHVLLVSLSLSLSAVLLKQKMRRNCFWGYPYDNLPYAYVNSTLLTFTLFYMFFGKAEVSGFKKSNNVRYHINNRLLHINYITF